MIVGEDIFIMLLVQEFFKTFTKKQIADAEKSTEVIVALAMSSKEEVNAIVKKSLDAGGKITKELGYMEGMYGGGFQDLDGHLWEVFYMDTDAIKQD
jgi:predicted lactoylglutathione lyase